MSCTVWLLGAIAAVCGWIGLETAVSLWLQAHRATIVALGAGIGARVASLFGFLRPTTRRFHHADHDFYEMNAHALQPAHALRPAHASTGPRASTSSRFK